MRLRLMSFGWAPSRAHGPPKLHGPPGHCTPAPPLVGPALSVVVLEQFGQDNSQFENYYFIVEIIYSCGARRMIRFYYFFWSVF